MLTNKNWAMKGFSSLAGLLMLLMCGCSPSGPKALLQGQKYLEEGKYEKALRSFNRAAETMPNFPQVWNHIGLAYQGMNDGRKAGQAYEQALRLDRNLPAAHYNLGVLYLDQGRYPEAVNELSTYTALKPAEPDGWKQVGKALLRAKRPDEAERALHTALKFTPKDAEIYNELGILHMQRKRPREALQAFNNAQQLNPSYGPALLNQAIIAQEYLGDKKIALERYKAYLATNPRTPDVPQILRVVSQLEEELAPKPKVVASVPPPVTVEAPAVVTPPAPLKSNTLVQAAPPSPAPTKTNIVAQTRPAVTPATNPPTHIVVNSGPSTNHSVKTNIVEVPSKNLASSPTPVEQKTGSNAPIIVATTEPPKEKPDEIEEEHPAPVEVVKLSQEPVFKAPVDVLSNKRTNAASSAAAANIPAEPEIENRPLFAPRKKEEKTSLVSKMNPVRWFRKEESTENSEPPQVSKSKAPLQTVRVGSTITRPNLDLSTNGPVAGPPKVIARYPYRKNFTFVPGKHDQAERYFKEGAEAQSEKRYPAAISAYQKAVALDPKYFDAYYNLGLAALQAGNLPLALSINEEAVALNPESLDARYNFALTLRDAHYYTDAANELRELITRSQDEVRAHFALANIYAQYLDEPKLAQEQYVRVLELKPNHPQAAIIREWLANPR